MTVDTTDPFAATSTVNGERPEDPFATPEDAKGGGGTFTPSPSGPEGVHGCLVALIPRKYESKAPKPEEFRQNPEDATRERYTCDLYILEGPEAGKPFTFGYNAKVEGSDERTWTEHTIGADEFPYAVERWWVVQLALLGQIRKVADSTRPILLGRVRRGPKAKDRGKKDFATVEREWSEYVARGQRGTKPEFSWQVEVSEAGSADHAKALAWWRSSGVELTPVEKIN